jgi:prevent-host-death family protein
MKIALSELKVNVGKYVAMAEKEDVIIMKYGKPAAKIIAIEKKPWYEKEIPETLTSIEQLVGTLPPDIDLDEMKMERIMRKSGFKPE